VTCNLMVVYNLEAICSRRILLRNSKATQRNNPEEYNQNLFVTWRLTDSGANECSCSVAKLAEVNKETSDQYNI
jgi:hypothetical protein